MSKSNFSNRIIKAMEEIISSQVNLDEKTDMTNEPNDTTENPDEKTKSKKSKRAMIHELEAAWKKNKASDSPEEIVQESIEMSKASIKSIVRHANSLMMGLNESNQMGLSEGWVQSKITIIEDYLKSVHDYVMYYEEEGNEQEVED